MSHDDRREGRRGPRRRSVTRPAERNRAADPARRVAFDVLRAVDVDGAYANLELPRRLRRAGLTGRDAAFATELAYGAIRMQGLYDAIVAEAAGRPVSRIDAPVLDLLRLGAHQLLGMRVPPHAACDTTVALARETHGPGVTGLVNAVLHRISERDREEWVETVVDKTGADPVRRLSVTFSHPEWMVRALRSALIGHSGAEADDIDVDDELTALLEAHNTPAAVSLVARPGLCDRSELTDAGARLSELVPTAATMDGGDPGGLAAVRQGRAAVQDEGSQLIALALAAAPLIPTGPAGTSPEQPTDSAADSNEQQLDNSEQWLDMCAGPGGKAGLLAALAAQRGAVLFANEVSEHRARLVRRTVEAAVEAGAQVFVGTGDGREIGELEPGNYDRVLVDAPCTGLGALRRRPEARWRRTPADVTSLTALQGELLDSALLSVRPGGVVLYATCSPHLAETRYVVADALKRAEARGMSVETLDASEVFAEVATGPIGDTGQAPFVQLWSHRQGTDGMFAALLRRRP